MAGHPPVSPRRSTASPRWAANPASSSPEKRRSSSASCSTAPWVVSRVSGTAGAQRLASSTWPLAGRASTSAVSQRAPGEPGGSQWASSITRHTAAGARRQTASATAAGPGGSGGATTGSSPVPAPGGEATAAIRSRASISPSASPGARPSQTSSPREARRFSATAWARSVVLPSPGPPANTVTRCSQRPSSARSRRGRVSEPDLGSGGSNRNERGMWLARLSPGPAGWGDRCCHLRLRAR
jgi:hypothetical protein